MASSLADSPPASPPGGQAPSNGSNGAPHEPTADSAPVAPPERACANCAAPMAAGQDWCLECGAGARGSLGSRSWRSAATIAALVTVLVLGAAAAAVAALTKGHAKTAVVIRTVAQVPAPTTPAPTTPGAGTTTPGTPGTVPGTKLKLPSGTVIKPPKIPLTQVTPKASEIPPPTPTTEAKTTTPTTSTPTSTTPSGGANGGDEKPNEESQQSAILLDTNAASTYNPYEYPATGFGDPSLAIDGDTSTAWTAAVNPATAPKMAQGLLINLKGKQKISAMQLVTATPGIRIQVYGANVATAPTSITDPAWVRLSPPRTVKKKRLRMSLRDSSKAFQFVTVWISLAPASALGTATAPGHVDINEVELFPPR